MKKSTTLLVFGMAMTAALGLFCFAGGAGSLPALAAAPRGLAPTVTAVDPQSASNDLDTPIVITGTNFTNNPSPTVRLGSILLSNAAWVASGTLTATVPWGVNPGVYDLTVSNSDGQSGTLTKAFTVTQGIGVWNSGQFNGGEVRQIAINPITSTTIYARPDAVGLFRSRDAGANWTFVYANNPVYNVSLDPLAPNHIYLTTWELFRSDDEGDTWIKLFSDWPGGGRVGIMKTYPHPTVSGTVYVISEAFAGDPTPGNGIYKSTNYGATWQEADAGLTDRQVTALAFLPSNPQIMFVGTETGKLFRSTDGGDSWNYVSQPTSNIGLIQPNPYNVGEVWIAPSCAFGASGGELLKNSNAELTEWTDEFAPPWQKCVTSIKFVGAETMFTGDLWNSPGQKTTDGGQNWSPFGPPTAVNDIELLPGDPSTIYAGDLLRGVQKSTDGGQTWSVIDNGLQAMVPSQLTANPAQPSEAFAVMPNWNGIFKSIRGGETWKFIPITGTTSVGDIVIDPFSPSSIYVADASGIYISNDDAQTWDGPIVIPPDLTGPSCDGLEPGVSAADPFTRGTLLVGVAYWDCNQGEIFRSTNHGANWTPIHLSEAIPPIYDIVFDPAHPGQVYATTWGSVFLSSSDSGATWHLITPPWEPSYGFFQTLTIEPTPPYRLFARYATGPVAVSNDGGLSWIPVTFPVGAVNQLLFTPSDPPTLYAGTSEGLSLTTDGGQTWQRAAGALGYAGVKSLAVVATTDRIILYAGTSGGTLGGSAAPVRSKTRATGGSQSLVNAGVYRFTTLLPIHIYLPLLKK